MYNEPLFFFPIIVLVALVLIVLSLKVLFRLFVLFLFVLFFWYLLSLVGITDSPWAYRESTESIYEKPK